MIKRDMWNCSSGLRRLCLVPSATQPPVSTPPNAIAYATGKTPVRMMMRTGGLISIIAAGAMLLGYRFMLPLVF